MRAESIRELLKTLKIPSLIGVFKPFTLRIYLLLGRICVLQWVHNTKLDGQTRFEIVLREPEMAVKTSHCIV